MSFNHSFSSFPTLSLSLALTHHDEVAPPVPFQIYQVSPRVLHNADGVQQGRPALIGAVRRHRSVLQLIQDVPKLGHQVQVDADQVARLIHGGYFRDFDKTDAILFLDVKVVALAGR